MSSYKNKVLGILGGMGPAATAEFLRLLSIMAPAKKDQEHPKIYLLSNPQIPDRTQAILGNGPDPYESIKEGLDTLVQWGADLLAVPCNTAHFFIDKMANFLPVPLVHIVISTLDEAIQKDKRGAWLLATEGTIKTGLYDTHAKRKDFTLLRPNPGIQKEISTTIALVKEGNTEKAGAILNSTVKKLWEESSLPVIAACTELPIAYAASGLPKERMISSLEALARACIKELY
ncbi:amino acid racemase [Thermovirga sp.]|uniref:aspartate/glutamate racemase family protein n=1 Tax=Thermovirga sp. TaxID=2699834 RepID=UPI0025F53D9D|nr:amino acid racemase [Thermovirga sp.]MBO8154598.1 aspartate/glutamate racemase family protein [Thermovirga sp.]